MNSNKIQDLDYFESESKVKMSQLQLKENFFWWNKTNWVSCWPAAGAAASSGSCDLGTQPDTGAARKLRCFTSWRKRCRCPGESPTIWTSRASWGSCSASCGCAASSRPLNRRKTTTPWIVFTRRPWPASSWHWRRTEMWSTWRRTSADTSASRR